MRLKHVKGAEEYIASSKYVVQDYKEQKGKWKELFENDNPLHIEIGMGKGKFLIEMAEKNPDINYIGIEKFSSVLIRAVQKREQLELNNLIFVLMDATEIAEVFDGKEIDKIYLNFSDPWPKDRHAKRRLTSRVFLDRYDSFLKKDGVIEFKTDNHDLFMFSLDEVNETKWILDAVTYDLHSDAKMNEGNIMTEYEQRFSEMGNPIYKYIISR